MDGRRLLRALMPQGGFQAGQRTRPAPGETPGQAPPAPAAEGRGDCRSVTWLRENVREIGLVQESGKR